MHIVIILLQVAFIITIILSGRKTMSAIDNLATEIAENTSAVDSAVVLLTTLKQKLDEAIASGDMGRVQDLSNALSAKTDELAAAVAANTPADPEAPTP